MGSVVNPETKQAIMSAIRDEGMKVTDASRRYGVTTKSIYRWLQDGVEDGSQNLILENNRLKKENEQLYAMLGRATAQLQRPKK